MFCAPQAFYVKFSIVLLGFKLHLYILPCLSLKDLSEYIYFCINLVLEHSSKKPRNHMFRAPQALLNQYPYVLLDFRPQIYFLPCSSLQDLSEYIIFCTNFLNSSRTFIKKASKFTFRAPQAL